MGKAPAVVIVARHGARLDAADDQWQTNSQSPYDSPLSYGGWTQTRALGARIASLLHARGAAIADEDARTRRRKSDASRGDRSSSRGHSSQPRARRKTKILIHTSPFLRCVQSSIAISAGLAQYNGNLARLEARPKSPLGPKPFSGHSRAQTLDSKAFEDKYLNKNLPTPHSPISEEDEDLQQSLEKPFLRIDACLGEWLSPDYYDFTTSPPPSNMMVALAKAELLRSAEPLQGAKILEPDGSVTEFATGDANGRPMHHRRQRSSTLGLDEIARAMPPLDPKHRAPLPTVPDEDLSLRETTSSEQRSRYAGYIPPTPTYALLHTASIPQGYVAHARDACIDIDFQWDSMREPQSWGDGGTFGEEWSSMHRRFRGGLASMIAWYRDKGPDYDPQDDDKLADQDDYDDDTDIVLVIMTHGAGCNALIGALTNQPVLMDVGMGALTMAVQKPQATRIGSPLERRISASNPGRRRRSSAVDAGLSEEYDVKLMASTEHLRAGPDPLVIPQLSHPGSMPAILEHSRRGSVATSGTATPQEIEPRSKNSSLGSMRRTSVRVKPSQGIGTAPLITSPTSSGLWGSRAPTVDRVGEEQEPALKNGASHTTSGAAERNESAQTRHHSIGETPMSATAGSPPPGLWGAAPKEESRRRYTVGARR